MSTGPLGGVPVSVTVTTRVEAGWVTAIETPYVLRAPEPTLKAEVRLLTVVV